MHSVQNDKFGLGKKALRHKKILDLLLESNMMTVHDLCSVLICSEATIRNDLRELSGQGKLKRIFGGAVPTGNTYQNKNVIEHSMLHQKEKEAIGKYIRDNLIEDGQRLILDLGTTATILGFYLGQSDFRLNVVTNSLFSAVNLAHNPNISITMPGGIYDNYSDSFDSASLYEFYKNLNADCYFVSVNGISNENGLTLPSQRLANLKRLIMEKSGKVVLIADHYKFGITAFFKFADVSDIDILITDGNCPSKILDTYRKLNIEVISAPILEQNSISNIFIGNRKQPSTD
jgi:DeoR family fructose operon transcriptional repressor